MRGDGEKNNKSRDHNTLFGFGNHHGVVMSRWGEARHRDVFRGEGQREQWPLATHQR